MFLGGVFTPVIPSLSKSPSQDDISVGEDIVQCPLNPELNLSDAEHYYEEILLQNNTYAGGFAPLDWSQTFYETVGRIYKRPADYAELVSWYMNLEQNYSEYITVFKANEMYGTGVVNKTGGGSYDLYYVRVTNESLGFHKPEVFFCGGPHGHEKIGAIGLYWTLDWLMRHAFHPAYDCPERMYLRWLLDNCEIYINVFHNPDGFDQNSRYDYLGRDLNREYDHNATLPVFASVNGQTMKAFVNDHLIRTTGFFHTGGRNILYPWQIEHPSSSGVSPISGVSYGQVPTDFYFFDAAYLLMGAYIGDYGGDLGPNQIGSSYSMGFGDGGVSTSWGYAGNNLSHPVEDQYVEMGPHLGAGILTTTLEMSPMGNPPESFYGNDTVDRFGAEVRRIVLYMTDIAQPSVHWNYETPEECIEIEPGDTLDVSWMVQGCLVVDNTSLQYGTDPDPIHNPMYFTSPNNNHSGDYYGGSYWDNAESGNTSPTIYTEGLTFPETGEYYLVAKAMVDQKYAELLRPDYYGNESYLRLIQERTNASFYESLNGADGIEVTSGQLWWYSPILHVRVTEKDNHAPLLTNPIPSDGATDVAPIPSLTITVDDSDGDVLTVLLKSNSSESWQILGEFNNVSNGTYSLRPQGMNEYGKTYFWSVHCFDGNVWVNQTHCYTMSTSLLTLKWTKQLQYNLYGFVVAGDINGDGAAEVFQAGGGMANCLDGTTGNIIWQRPVVGGGSKPQMADCNGDGILDLIVTISWSGIEVLHGANGTTYWRTTGLGGHSEASPVAFDINGDSCAEVFYASEDITNGWNGTGRVTSLTHDGHIVNQIFAFRPCAGGLSIADTNFDGQFELYMGDRDENYSNCSGVPRGLRAFLIDEDGTLHCNWNRSDILMSSHCPMIADVNGDGKLDIIACHQRGGIWVIDSTNGTTINGAYTVRCSDNQRFPGHYQPSVCDIDGDGHLELLAADGDHPENYTSDDVAIWDLVSWIEKGLLPHICKMGPTTGDVTGDGQLDVLVCSYHGIHVYTWNHTTSCLQFLEEHSGFSGIAGPAHVTDIDGDGYNEIIVGTSNSWIYAYDTFAPSPTPRALAGTGHYSTYRNGQAIYTEPPGITSPLFEDIYPVNNSLNNDISPTLSVKVIDYQHDPINITISTNVTGSWIELTIYENMNTGNTYFVPCTAMNLTNTTYYWRITATDGLHTTMETFKFNTYIPPPFKSGWLYRKKIVLNQSQIPSDILDFPVLIDITDAELSLRVKPNGEDLLFTGFDGETILDYEIEYYNNTTGHLFAWVKTNISASNATFIYMYYGNEETGRHENPEAVWDAHYMMIQHLHETSGIHDDSTSYHNNGTPINGVNQDSTGKVDGADEYDGIDDYSIVPHDDTLAGYSNGMTASFWFKLDTIEKKQTLLCKYNTNGDKRAYRLTYINSPAAFYLYASDDGINIIYWVAPFTPVAGEWYHVAFTWVPNTVPKFYINGRRIVVLGTQILTEIYNNTLEPLRIGSDYFSGRKVDGCLDEIRLSNIARSEAWVTTCYNNQAHPSRFYTVSLPSSPVYNYEIAVKKEWNIISIPINISVTKACITIKCDGINYTWAEAVNEGLFIDRLYGWNTQEQNYSPCDIFKPGKSYWFFAFHNCSLWLTSPLNNDAYITVLAQNWNFIGIPINEPLETQDLLVNYNGSVYSWNDAIATHLIMDSIFFWDANQYNITSSLQPGKGYWIYAYHECTLKKDV